MKKTIITVLGKDTVGIMAKVCTYLADNNVNILDISQTIVDDYFNMMMICDSNKSSKEFEVLATEIEKVGEEIGVKITMQHEDIFNLMHRI
ncbi:ACT domain-containing protein [Eubacterium sp.]|uniref:ACT domain-containing protein n=1 Tax=Eubacterium sp. TaxID=142586 RepID=UPI000E9C2EF5|nr:ACT domain-containing protein [Eubacterium sp.]MCR5628273.1 ACT domain-containing protein [Eubacterium sp.]HAH18703.1 ACT domain-containing protein [Eubacterium sp.]HAV90369.1 ACT domain-containing protein [Eubacterium sp.]